MLICAALIGRRVFVFAAVALVVVKFGTRLLQRDTAPVDPPETEPAARPWRRAPEAVFRPPPDAGSVAMPDVSSLRDALKGVLVGQRDVIDALLIALIAGGHVLFEGAPGLAKTLACRTLAQAVDGTFARVQCTADLLPADILGSEIFDPRDLSFRTRLGPLFANVVLLDEINRAPARTQAALFEALGERQVTLGGQTHTLPDMFVALATMNEMEPDGIYQLPAAQLDRFLLKVVLDFPSAREELVILERFGHADAAALAPVVSPEDVRSWRAAAQTIYCAPVLKDYIVALVCATRDRTAGTGIERGAGPRASLALARAARAKAMLAGRNFVLPEDVRAIACAALRHRIAFVRGFLLDRHDVEARLDSLVGAVPGA